MLRAVFPVGDIFAVSDDGELGHAAEEYGLIFVGLDETEKVPEGANVIVLLRRNLISIPIRKLFRKHRALVVPVASFDTGSEAALYTLRMLLLTDYAAAADMAREWTNGISGNLGPLVFESNGASGHRTNLVCTLASSLKMDGWLSPVIEIGQWVSIGAYCELSLTAPSTQDWTGAFVLDGTVAASGALVARDSRYNEVGDARIRAAMEVRDELSEHTTINLELEKGTAVSITAGGKDFTDAVRQATNPDYDLHALELGIGTNLALLPHIDWRLNSQLNEGAGCVHIGFGEGMTGAHMDFIVAEGSHHFEPTAAS
jgi:hypothetical protein